MTKTDEKVRIYRKGWHKQEVMRNEVENKKEKKINPLQQQGCSSFMVIHHETHSGIIKRAECQVAKSPII